MSNLVVPVAHIERSVPHSNECIPFAVEHVILQYVSDSYLFGEKTDDTDR